MPRLPDKLTSYDLEVLSAPPKGEVELVVDADHFTRVVRHGILQAKISLDIMTADFKAMLIPNPIGLKRSRRSRSHSAPSIVHHLRKLADHGVEIRLLHAGTPSSAALQELRQQLPQNLTIRRCPRLHAKTVIVDTRAMYLGSANLTGAGLGAKADGKRNFELGIWTQSPSLIESVLESFNSLWEGNECRTCRRKDICPVPLEEPSL